MSTGDAKLDFINNVINRKEKKIAFNFHHFKKQKKKYLYSESYVQKKVCFRLAISIQPSSDSSLLVGNSCYSSYCLNFLYLTLIKILDSK